MGFDQVFFAPGFRRGAAALVLVGGFLTAPLSPVEAITLSASDSVELQVFNVDDNVTARLSNADVNGFLIGTRGFGSAASSFNIDDHLITGSNTLNIQATNGPSGWTLGWDLLVNGSSVANFSCGVFNTFGCNDDEYRTGVVYDTDIDLTVVPPRPPPPTAMLMYSFQQGVDDTFSTANGPEEAFVSGGFAAHLATLGPSAGFDVATTDLNRGVSFNLSSVQGDIVSAILSFRAIPLDNNRAEGNDEVSLLGFDPAGNPLFAGHSIGLGIDAGPNSLFDFDWQIDGRPQVPPEGFTVAIDLGNFDTANGTGFSILGDMQDAKLLDVLVGDDTNLDFVRLDIKSMAAPVPESTPLALILMFSISLALARSLETKTSQN